jgi:hypothetical protein
MFRSVTVSATVIGQFCRTWRKFERGRFEQVYDRLELLPLLALYLGQSYQVISATGFDRVAASHLYANRTTHTFRPVKTHALDDSTTSLILYIHCSMKQLRDTQIDRQIPKRNLHQIKSFTTDNGYDWTKFLNIYGNKA